MYSEDWGEGLTNKSAPVLCAVNLQIGFVSVLQGVPPDVSPGQVRTDRPAAPSPDSAGLRCFRTVGLWRSGLKSVSQCIFVLEYKFHCRFTCICNNTDDKH